MATKVIQAKQLPPYLTDETDSLIVTLDILPTATTPNYQEKYPRLTVDSTEIAIRFASWSETRDGLSTELSFTLHDIADRSLILATSSIKFEVGTVLPSGTTWTTIVDLAELTNQNFQIAGDTFSFSIKSGVAEKLNLTPTAPLVVYDPARVPFDATEIEVLRDTEGREYPVEDFPLADLTLYDLFNEILVNRCGFTAYETNIPDYPVRRGDFAIGSPFINGIAPLIGAFEPVIFEDGTTIWILDTTQELPSGYPSPRDLTAFGCRDATVSSRFGQFDYAEMVYSVPDTFDYFTTRYETESRTNGGTLVAGTLVTTVITRIIAEFRNFAAPDLIMKEEIKTEIKESYKGVVAGNPIHHERVDNTFDSFGRLSTGASVVHETLPDPSTASSTQYLESENVTTDITYAQHPRILAKQYQKRLTRKTSSLVTEDTDNPYAYSSDTKFRQKLEIAHRAGNVVEGQAVALLPTASHEEEARVLANGQIRQTVTDADLISDTVKLSITEAKVGDVSLNGSQSQAQRLLVFDPPDDTITTGKKLTVAVGDVPIDIATALTIRKLRRAQSSTQQASLSLIGIDLSVRRGSVFTVKNKQFGVEGTFLCVGFQGQFTASPEGNQFNMTVDGIMI